MPADLPVPLRGKVPELDALLHNRTFHQLGGLLLIVGGVDFLYNQRKNKLSDASEEDEEVSALIPKPSLEVTKRYMAQRRRVPSIVAAGLSAPLVAAIVFNYPTLNAMSILGLASDEPLRIDGQRVQRGVWYTNDECGFKLTHGEAERARSFYVSV